MSVSILTDDVIIGILYYVRICLDCEYDAFKKNLVLLSVNRRWRYLAQPMVYKTLFIQYGTYESKMPIRHNKIKNKSKHVEIISNVNLIALCNTQHMVKKLDIGICYLNNPLYGFGKVTSMLADCMSVWPQVRLLKFAMYAISIPYHQQNKPKAKYKNDESAICSKFCQLVPGIKSIGFPSANHSSIVHKIYGLLTNNYGHGLLHFNSKTHAALPRYCTDSLVSLELHEAICKHTWAGFICKEGAEFVEFSCLRFLHVAYSPENYGNNITTNALPTNDRHHAKLYFPKLETLYIQCTFHACPLLMSAMFPTFMKQITISGSASALCALYHVLLPRTEAMSVKLISDNQEAVPNIFSTISRVFGMSNKRKNAELEIEDAGISALPAYFEVFFLTKLLVAAPTCVDTMLGLIQQLPNLRSLTFFRLTLQSIPPNVANFEAADYIKAASPATSHIERLAVNYNSSIYSCEAAVSVVAYLLFKLPALKRLIAPQVEEKLVVDLVRSYAHIFPHLQDINLRLAKPSDPIGALFYLRAD